jgi:hypothetical protein
LYNPFIFINILFTFLDNFINVKIFLSFDNISNPDVTNEILVIVFNIKLILV